MARGLARHLRRGTPRKPATPERRPESRARAWASPQHLHPCARLGNIRAPRSWPEDDTHTPRKRGARDTEEAASPAIDPQTGRCPYASRPPARIAAPSPKLRLRSARCPLLPPAPRAVLGLGDPHDHQRWGRDSKRAADLWALARSAPDRTAPHRGGPGRLAGESPSRVGYSVLQTF